MKLKNILAGVGSLLVLFPAGSAPMVNTRVGNDRDNMAKDWVAVGKDFRTAINKTAKTNVKTKQSK